MAPSVEVLRASLSLADLERHVVRKSPLSGCPGLIGHRLRTCR